MSLKRPKDEYTKSEHRVSEKTVQTEIKQSNHYDDIKIQINSNSAFGSQNKQEKTEELSQQQNQPYYMQNKSIEEESIRDDEVINTFAMQGNQTEEIDQGIEDYKLIESSLDRIKIESDMLYSYINDPEGLNFQFQQQLDGQNDFEADFGNVLFFDFF